MPSIAGWSVASLADARIETMICTSICRAITSHPSRMRGLKLRTIRDVAAAFLVASLADARIETHDGGWMGVSASVASLADARIETLVAVSTAIRERSHPVCRNSLSSGPPMVANPTSNPAQSGNGAHLWRGEIRRPLLHRNLRGPCEMAGFQILRFQLHHRSHQGGFHQHPRPHPDVRRAAVRQGARGVYRRLISIRMPVVNAFGNTPSRPISHYHRLSAGMQFLIKYKYNIDAFVPSNYPSSTFSKPCNPPYSIPIIRSRPGGRWAWACPDALGRSDTVSRAGPENPSQALRTMPSPRRQAGSSRSEPDHRFFENPARSCSRRGFCFSDFPNDLKSRKRCSRHSNQTIPSHDFRITKHRA